MADATAQICPLCRRFRNRLQKIVLYGTSAGAALAAEVAVRLKATRVTITGGTRSFIGRRSCGVYGDSASMYGVEGLSGSLSIPQEGLVDPYNGKTDPRNPVLSPQFADLRGMPRRHFS